MLSNNLANASTPGFRAEMSTFRSVPLQGDGASNRVFALEATRPPGHRRPLAAHRPQPGRHGHGQRLVLPVQGLTARRPTTRRLVRVSATRPVADLHRSALLSDGGAPMTSSGAEVSLARRHGHAPPPGSAAGRGPHRAGHAPAGRPLKRGDDGLFRAAANPSPTTPTPAWSAARWRART